MVSLEEFPLHPSALSEVSLFEAIATWSMYIRMAYKGTVSDSTALTVHRRTGYLLDIFVDLMLTGIGEQQELGKLKRELLVEIDEIM